jgi:hypothetical protein
VHLHIYIYIYTTAAVRSIDVVEPEEVYLPADGWGWDEATRDETVSKCGCYLEVWAVVLVLGFVPCWVPGWWWRWMDVYIGSEQHNIA